MQSRALRSLGEGRRTASIWRPHLQSRTAVASRIPTGEKHCGMIWADRRKMATGRREAWALEQALTGLADAKQHAIFPH
jgi:hypothetical protein